MDEKSVLEYISTVSEVNNTCEYMKDEQLEKALDMVIKFFIKPEIPSAKVPMLLVEIESMAAIFSLKKTYYSTIERGRAGTEENNKKNIYYTVSESLQRIADALKYVAKLSL